MKYVVTGGAGFIGSQLIDRLLTAGNEVIAIDNMSWGNKDFLSEAFSNPRFSLLEFDLLDYEKLLSSLPKDTDMIFHLAANSDIARGGIDPTIDFQHTTTVTFNVLRAMKEHGIKKLLYTSGSGVYGDVGSTVTSESFGPLLPVSMYGATKLSAEAMISAFSNLYEIQAWILRPANIIGPRATHGVIFDFIKKLRQNSSKLAIFGDGKQSKSYLYIEDVLNAIELIISRTNERINLFNIASVDAITVTEIAQIIISKMKLHKVKIEYTGGPIGWKGDVPVVRLDTSALKKLGWTCEHSSRQAVEKTVDDLLQ